VKVAIDQLLFARDADDGFPPESGGGSGIALGIATAISGTGAGALGTRSGRFALSNAGTRASIDAETSGCRKACRKFKAMRGSSAGARATSA